MRAGTQVRPVPSGRFSFDRPCLAVSLARRVQVRWILTSFPIQRRWTRLASESAKRGHDIKREEAITDSTHPHRQQFIRRLQQLDDLRQRRRRGGAVHDAVVGGEAEREELPDAEHSIAHHHPLARPPHRKMPASG